MVTARDSEIDKVVGLEIGADDYVTKPYSPRELVARIRAVLRRSAGRAGRGRRRRRWPPARSGWTSSGTWSPSPATPVPLPLKEFELLELLLRNAGRVLTRGQLIDRVWGADYVGDTKTLDVHVKRLRSKIEPEPSDAALHRHRARPGLQVRALTRYVATRRCGRRGRRGRRRVRGDQARGRAARRAELGQLAYAASPISAVSSGPYEQVHRLGADVRLRRRGAPPVQVVPALAPAAPVELGQRR